MRTALTLTLASLLLLGSAATAEPTCQTLDGLGEICYELGEESGSISYDIENEETGLDAEGEIAYGIGL